MHPAGMPETGPCQPVRRTGMPLGALFFTCPFIDLPGGFRLLSACDLHPAGMAEQSRRSEPRADLPGRKARQGGFL